MRIVKQSVKLEGLMWPVGWDRLAGEYLPVEDEGPETLIETAGRTCYKSEDKITPTSSTAFIEMVCKRQHESVLEHSCASFRFITDRGISHEIVRHRLASYSQESTRYVNYTKDKHGAGDIQFVLPLGLTPEQIDLFLLKYQADQEFYNKAIAMGMTPQQARDGLPTGLKTELVMSANFREWRTVCRLRMGSTAHPKMRALINEVWLILKGAAPSVFDLEEFRVLSTAIMAPSPDVV